jgi:hypothetical protein
MGMSITRVIQVTYVDKGQFPHYDRTRSWNSQGVVHDAQTGEELGPALFSMTKMQTSAFSLNLKDWGHASREGSKCKFLCFRNTVSGHEFAVDMDTAKALVDDSIKSKGIQEGKNGSRYVLIDISAIMNGPLEETPF